jgi:monoamine oxidase
VVVSVPTALYNTIHFEPGLPPGKHLQAENATFGYYTKVIFVFDHPWWRENHLSGILTSVGGLISVTRDTSISVDNQWSITCFIVGERGKRWSKLPKGERYKQAWDTFRKAFEAQVKDVPDPINTLEWEWSKQQYFWGAPTPVLEPGLLSRVGADLGAPFGNVHFVGSELAKMWKGFMEGALRSGQHGADQVVAEIKGTKAKRVHVL